MRLSRARITLAFAAVLYACGGDASGPQLPTQVTITGAQSGVVRSTVLLQVSTLKDGKAFKNAHVRLTTTGGTLSADSVVTGTAGTASVQLTLPQTVGAVTVTATTGGLSASAVVQATAGTAATMTKVAGDAQTARTDESLANSIRVRVLDQYGNPVSGATVTFAGTGGAVPTPTSATTDAAGEATTAVRLGPVAGAQGLTATSGAATASFSFTAQARFTTIVVTPPAPTLVSLGDTLQLTATARDGTGAAVSGVTFTWSSSDATTVQVSTTGRVTAVKNGTATITATSGGINGTLLVTVAQAPARVSISPALAVVRAGGTQAFTAAAADARGNALPAGSATLATRNAAVLALNGATGTGGTAGSTFVVVSAGTFRDSAAVAVVATNGYAAVLRPAAGTYADTVAPNASVTVELAFMLPAGATATLGSVQGTVTWNPAQLRFAQAQAVGTALTWIPNESATATGRLAFSAFSATGVNNEFVLATLRFDALAAGTAPAVVTLDVEFAGTAEGTSIGRLIIEIPATILIRS